MIFMMSSTYIKIIINNFKISKYLYIWMICFFVFLWSYLSIYLWQTEFLSKAKTNENRCLNLKRDFFKSCKTLSRSRIIVISEEPDVGCNCKCWNETGKSIRVSKQYSLIKLFSKLTFPISMFPLLFIFNLSSDWSLCPVPLDGLLMKLFLWLTIATRIVFITEQDRHCLSFPSWLNSDYVSFLAVAV